MEKVFWADPYQTTLETRVSKVLGNEVLFEKTIAYSFSGGQESDKAFIDDVEVVSSRKDGNLIYYQMPEDHAFLEGQNVLMIVDWERRLKLMRLHFAAELILEIVTRKFHFEKVGAHISELKSRIDFICDFNISSSFDDILAEYNSIIERDLKIETGFNDVKTQRRFWKIDGFAEVPCGGTHVKSTGEVGFVTLKRSHPGKSIERIEIRLAS